MFDIVFNNAVKIPGHCGAAHAAFQHREGFEVKYDIGRLMISIFEIFAHSHDFINLTIGFTIVRQN
jgi:hypothetical protein